MQPICYFVREERSMRVAKCFHSGCMSLRTIKRASRKLRRSERVQRSTIEKIAEENLAKIAEKKIAELLFERCIGTFYIVRGLNGTVHHRNGIFAVLDCGRMATIPQGAFAACKVRRNLERNSMITPMDEKVGKENAFSERPPLEGAYPMLYQTLVLLYFSDCVSDFGSKKKSQIYFVTNYRRLINFLDECLLKMFILTMSKFRR